MRATSYIGYTYTGVSAASKCVSTWGIVARGGAKTGGGEGGKEGAAWAGEDRVRARARIYI